MLATRPAVYALALLPAVLWGLAPILAKRGLIDGGSSRLAALFSAGIGAGCYWLALLTLRGPAGIAGLPPRVVGLFALTGALGAYAWLGSFAGVDRVGASINSAGFATHPLFAAVLGLAWLGEALAPATAAGIVVLMLGLAVLALSEGGDLGGWRPAALVWPLSAAAAYGVANVVRRLGLTATAVTTLDAITINTSVTFVVVLGYMLLRQPADLRSGSRRTYGYFAASGLLSAVALLSLFAALDRGPVAVVSALSGTAPAFTALFTYGLLRDVERVTRRVAVGVGLVVIGGILITV